MKLYHTRDGVILDNNGRLVRLQEEWPQLINHIDLVAHLRKASDEKASAEIPRPILAPIHREEVWAAGVTYMRNREARNEESQDGGAGSFYDKVYTAQRPELFFKSTAWRVRAHGQPVRIRRDAKWSVPAPELALHINSQGDIVGYSIGNDMSSRDIEGENPLYLPQAKIYDGSCALGPCMLVHEAPLPPDTCIDMQIVRSADTVFEGSTTISQMHRTPAQLVEYLYRESSFPDGCVLFTGTGVVPPDDFALQVGDEVRIVIPPIGELVNRVEA